MLLGRGFDGRGGAGKVAGDAAHAQPVGAVGRDLEVDGGLEPERLDRARADGQAVGQFDDAVGLLGHLQFLGRTEHAVGDDAAHGLGNQRDAGAGDVGADGRVGGDEARAGVEAAADREGEQDASPREAA